MKRVRMVLRRWEDILFGVWVRRNIVSDVIEVF